MAAKWYKTFTGPIRELRGKLDEKKWEAKEKSFGKENPDQTFYVIRSRFSSWGLIAVYNHVLGHIKLARKQGYIPVVDLQNYDNTYLDPDKRGKENAWEYYFLQPDRYSLADVYRSRNVILMDGMPPKEAHPRGQGLVYLEKEKNAAEIAENNRIIRDCMKLQPDVQQHIERQHEKLFVPGKKTLGVLCRGSDIALRKPSGHSVMPTPSQMIEQARRDMDAFDCERIFITTEETAALDQFRDAFGDLLSYTDCVRYGNTGNQLLADIHFERENDRYLRGLEYLTNIVLLSRCDSMLAVYVGGTTGAMAMNGGAYDHIDIMDLGIYP